MNILQIVPNKGWGGGEKYVWELSHALTDAGHHVSVITLPCDIQGQKFADLHPIRLSFRGPYDVVAIYRLACLVRKQHIEVIHTHLFKHATAALLARQWFGLPVKVVMTRHLCRPAKLGLHYPWLYRQIDQLVFVSQQAKETFLSSHPAMADSKISVIPNSVYAVQVESPQPTPTNSRHFQIGFAGSLSHAKGLDFIVETATYIAQKQLTIEFRIAGRGESEYVSKLQEKIRLLHLDHMIHFEGFIENVIDFFRSVDIVILPSIEKEAFPLAALEAMVAGKALLYSSALSPEIEIKGTTGVCLDIQNPASSAQIIEKMFNHPADLLQMGQMAQQRFKAHFAYPKFLERIIALYTA